MHIDLVHDHDCTRALRERRTQLQEQEGRVVAATRPPISRLRQAGASGFDFSTVPTVTKASDDVRQRDLNGAYVPAPDRQALTDGRSRLGGKSGEIRLDDAGSPMRERASRYSMATKGS